ncbi:hypothetical protein ACL2XP_23125 [Sodalis sp. RH21]|uniref:hypothetical protein n=1 Tax=unclassified Sodalis (in: enterobacteria) TaxID=2636512 RepID=UPI0039B4A841
MKIFSLTIAALALSALSYGSFAADMNHASAYDGQQAAVITASDRHEMPLRLGNPNEKVAKDGARAYPMTSVSGQNNMHSTSVVYE